MKKIALLFILLASVATSYAQQTEYDGTRIGVKFNVGLSTLEGLDDGRTDHLPGTDIATSGFSVHNRFAASLGINVQHTWDTQAFLQADVDAALMGARLKGVYFEDYDGNRSNVNYINMYSGRLTLYAGKKFKLDEYNNRRFIVGFGPYFSYDSSDERIFHEYSEDWTIFEKMPDAMKLKSSIYAGEEINFRKFDVGASLMVGVELKHFQITANMYWGFLNMVKNESNTVNNRMYTIGVAYFLPMD